MYVYIDLRRFSKATKLNESEQKMDSPPKFKIAEVKYVIFMYSRLFLHSKLLRFFFLSMHKFHTKSNKCMDKL